MPFNTGYMVSTDMINVDLVGPSPQVGRHAGQPGVGYHGNTLLRSDWGVADMLRGAMGTYYSRTSHVAAGGMLAFVPNHLHPPQYSFPGGAPPNAYGSQGFGQGGLMLGNHLSPLTIQVHPSIDNLGFYGGRFTINPNLNVWNRHDVSNNTEDSIALDIDIRSAAPNTDMNYSGNPNWALYVRGSAGQHDWGNPIGAVNPFGGAPVTTDLPGVLDTTTIFTDHATTFKGLSDDLGDRISSGVGEVIVPVYNFYARTSPPYERISRDASEPMLANYYCLQSLMRVANDNRANESAIIQQLGEEVLAPSESPEDGSLLGSSGVAQEYFQQVTLEGKLQELDTGGPTDSAGNPIPDPLFVDLDPRNSTPPVYSVEKSQRLYKLYSNGINELKITNELDSVKDDFDSKYKNMVMLTSDVIPLSKLGVGDLKASGVSHLPFYNKITIPRMPSWRPSYIGMIRDELNASVPSCGDKFIDILQMYVSQDLLGTSEPTYMTAQVLNRQQLGNMAGSHNAVQAIPKVAALSRFIGDCRDYVSPPVIGAPSRERIGRVLRRITNSRQWSETIGDVSTAPGMQEGVIAATTSQGVVLGDNFVLLRDNDAEFAPSAAYGEAINKFLDLIDGDNLPQSHASVPPGWPARTAENLIAQPIYAQNETLMYQIKKRLLNPDGTPGTTVQTILLGKDFGTSNIANDSSDITYIDSQAKYGVRYFYEIRALTIVYGNAYTYRDLQVKTTQDTVMLRAAGSAAAASALGFAADISNPVVAAMGGEFAYTFSDPSAPDDVSYNNQAHGPAARSGDGYYNSKKFGYFLWEGQPGAESFDAVNLQSLQTGGTAWVWAAGSGNSNVAQSLIGREHLKRLKLRFVAPDSVGTTTRGSVVSIVYTGGTS